VIVVHHLIVLDSSPCIDKITWNFISTSSLSTNDVIFKNRTGVTLFLLIVRNGKTVGKKQGKDILLLRIRSYH
jgi:hypothetical protein